MDERANVSPPSPHLHHFSLLPSPVKFADKPMLLLCVCLQRLARPTITLDARDEPVLTLHLAVQRATRNSPLTELTFASSDEDSGRADVWLLDHWKACTE